MNGINIDFGTAEFLWTEQYRGTRLEAVMQCPGCNTPMARLTGWKAMEFVPYSRLYPEGTPEHMLWVDAVMSSTPQAKVGAGHLSGNLVDLWCCDDGPVDCKTRARQGSKVFVLNLPNMPKV